LSPCSSWHGAYQISTNSTGDMGIGDHGYGSRDYTGFLTL
jgi:hypothetical protein